jgi:hypothetical protein
VKKCGKCEEYSQSERMKKGKGREGWEDEEMI